MFQNAIKIAKESEEVYRQALDGRAYEGEMVPLVPVPQNGRKLVCSPASAADPAPLQNAFPSGTPYYGNIPAPTPLVSAPVPVGTKTTSNNSAAGKKGWSLVGYLSL